MTPISDYSRLNLEIRRTLAIVEPEIELLKTWATAIERAEVTMTAEAVEWDRDYDRVEKLEKARKAVSQKREAITTHLRPLWPRIGQMWATAGHSLNASETPEKACAFRTLSRILGWWGDCLYAYTPESEHAAIRAEGGFVSDAEIGALFGGEPEPEHGRCVRCGSSETGPVKSRCRNGTWQGWLRCRGCGENALGPGIWLRHEAIEDFDGLPVVDRDRPPSPLQQPALSLF